RSAIITDNRASCSFCSSSTLAMTRGIARAGNDAQRRCFRSESRRNLDEFPSLRERLPPLRDRSSVLVSEVGTAGRQRRVAVRVVGGWSGSPDTSEAGGARHLRPPSLLRLAAAGGLGPPASPPRLRKAGRRGRAAPPGENSSA